jgi:putative N6-adenine-specific DNA methylase
MMRANLWLRSASRVLARVTQFRATAFHELERAARRIPWDQYVGAGVDAEFRVTTHKSRLYHSDAIAQRLGNSVRSRAKSTQGVGRPAAGVGRASGAQLFVVRVIRDEFTISADTSGELLHMRGYRLATAKAPLRESLAAALLLACDWTGQTPLLDPFCGSGTIPIEAALIARRIAPGRHRSFAFMQWPAFDERGWRELLRDADAQALARSPVPIAGSDRDAGAIDAALANAQRAGVDADVTFSTRPLSAIEPPSGAGLVATNPPYGKRVGGEGASDVRNLYAQLGKVLRAKCAGWHTAFYVADAGLARQTRLNVSELLRTSNGGIRVTALTADVPVRSAEAG